jgi:hypothetical protein
MAVIAGFALRALVRPRGQGRGGLENLAIIAAVVMVGYNLFLFATYLAVFKPWEAEQATSYWRYNTHVGLIGMAVAVFGGAVLWRQRVQAYVKPAIGRALGVVTVVLIVLGPVGVLDRFRFDLDPMKLFARGIGASLSRMLPIDARLIVVDPHDPGFYALLVNYALDDRAHVVGAISSLTANPREALRRMIHDQRPTHLLALEPDPVVAAATETELSPNGATLLAREGDGEWQQTMSWVLPASGNQQSEAKSPK